MRAKLFILVLLAAFLLIPVVHAEDALEWTTKGQNAVTVGKYSEAITYFNNALALDAKFASALSGKAVALNAIGDYNGALEMANQCLAIRSQDQNALNAKALALFNLKQYDQAIAAYNDLFIIQQNRVEAYCNQGYAYLMLNETAGAITSYKKCTALNPQDIESWDYLGRSYRAHGDYDNALSAYDSATAITVRNATIWNNKGEVLVALNRTTEALQCFNKAVGLDPGYTVAQENRESMRGQFQYYNISGTITPQTTISRIGTFYTTKTPVPEETEIVIGTPVTEIIPAMTEEVPVTTATVAKKTTYSPLSPFTVFGALLTICGIVAVVKRSRR